MPRRTLGRKPPYWLQAMEIHRHYGVDFIIITQHPQLIDTTVRALVGLHRHVRSVMGSAVCMVYTWDHASNPERFTNSAKSQFIRRKSHYKLFHSAAAHVKPPTSGRSMCTSCRCCSCSWPTRPGRSTTASRRRRLQRPTRLCQRASRPHLARAPHQAHRSSCSSPARRGHPRLLGHGERCECQDGHGRRVVVDLGICKTSSEGYDGLVKWTPRAESSLASPIAASGPSMAAEARLISA
ncbi:zonular occludens toxin domain-containing protein [Methylibium sp.]|uniref:zonular occludens toxin domain-containing protein n=1 Tax=Methylibium sp. TaxID=2067992 RepID=UPI003BA85FF9